MFILKLFDRNGVELKEGNLVKISDGKGFSFFSEVKYLESENAIAPFHTFSFHSFVKIDELPEGAKQILAESGYRYWYIGSENAELDKEAEKMNRDYVLSWRECERLINTGCFRISKQAD